MNVSWRRALAAVVLVLFWGLPVWGDNPSRPEEWDATYETWPLDGDAVGQGDDWMRAVKTEVRERLEVEHHFGSVHADDTGLHRLGSGRCFFQSSAPTTLEPEGGTTTDHVNTAGGQSGVADLDTDSTAATDNVDGDDEIVGMGRCWIDSDDNSFHIYSNDDGSGSAGWVAVQEGNINLLENGSFEVQTEDCDDYFDDLGVPQTTGSADGFCDSDGVTPVEWTAQGWSDLLTPTTVIQDTDASNGLGFSLVLTAAGAANEGAQQTITGLRPSTVYKIQARVDAGAAPDTCSLTTSLAGTNAALTTATNNWETLTGTFTTDASADVTVQLESDADGDICEWDLVSVTELSAPYVPERLFDMDCTTTASNDAVESLLVRAQIPWSKSVLKAKAFVSFAVAASNNAYKIQENIDAAGAVSRAVINGRGAVTLPGSYTTLNPTVGSEYVYNIDVTAGTVVAPGSTPDNVACVILEAYPL